jgi:hypothetical protein
MLPSAINITYVFFDESLDGLFICISQAIATISTHKLIPLAFIEQGSERASTFDLRWRRFAWSTFTWGRNQLTQLVEIHAHFPQCPYVLPHVDWHA